jgi:hypothetical protein
MHHFSIQGIEGTNRIRITDTRTGRDEEIVVSEAVSARVNKAMSFVVPREIPSMKVCAFR